jgi:hypothetical protein
MPNPKEYEEVHICPVCDEELSSDLNFALKCNFIPK